MEFQCSSLQQRVMINEQKRDHMVEKHPAVNNPGKNNPEKAEEKIVLEEDPFSMFEIPSSDEEMMDETCEQYQEYTETVSDRQLRRERQKLKAEAYRRRSPERFHRNKGKKKCACLYGASCTSCNRGMPRHS